MTRPIGIGALLSLLIGSLLTACQTGSSERFALAGISRVEILSPVTVPPGRGEGARKEGAFRFPEMGGTRARKSEFAFLQMGSVRGAGLSGFQIESAEQAGTLVVPSKALV